MGYRGQWTALRSAGFVTLSGLIATVAVGACGALGSNAGDTSGAGAMAATLDAEAGLAVLPYPPGPYGGALGDVLPDFFVMGYAMSPAQRDSTKLPFQPIRLSEVRSTPGCTCIVVELTTSPANQPSDDPRLGVELANDPSLCALEILIYAQGTTRADLDQVTLGGREGFPVGIDTSSSAVALSTAMMVPGNWFGLPTKLIVRARDARLVGMIAPDLDLDGGSVSPIGAQAHALCDTPQPPVETLAAGLEPRNLVLAGSLYVTDASRGLLKFPSDKPGVAPTVIDPRPGDAVTADDANVYYAASGGGTFSLVAAALGGGPPVDLATGPHAFAALAVDGVNVYFARADGVVGSVPRDGGIATQLAFDGTLAPVIAVDAAYVYFVSTATRAIFGVPKNGGARLVVIQTPPPPAGDPEVSAFLPAFVRVAPQATYPIVAAGELTGTLSAYVAAYGALPGPVIPSEGGAGAGGVGGAPQLAPPGTVHGFGMDTMGNLLFTTGSDPTSATVPVAAGMLFVTGNDDGSPNALAPRMITPGEPLGRAITGDDHYAYYTTFPSQAGAHDGAVKRIRWH